MPEFLPNVLAEYCIEHARHKSNFASSRLTFIQCFIENCHRVPKESCRGGTNKRTDTQTYGYDRSISIFRRSIKSGISSKSRLVTLTSIRLFKWHHFSTTVTPICVFRDVMPCPLVNRYRNFEGPLCLLFTLTLIRVFWDVTSRPIVNRYIIFERSHCLHLQRPPFQKCLGYNSPGDVA